MENREHFATYAAPEAINVALMDVWQDISSATEELQWLITLQTTRTREVRKNTWGPPKLVKDDTDE
jgi:hypothetical protein